MKCPFLVKRKDIFDKEDKKIGETIEIQDCIRNECMVYDGAIRLCSLLSSNMKIGILIDDFKDGIKEIKEELFQRTEAIGVVISTTIQTMQDALLGRFDALKKQNEVMGFSFDELSQILNNKITEVNNNLNETNKSILSFQANLFETLKENSEKITGNFDTLKGTINSQSDGLKSAINSIKESSNQLMQGQTKFAEEIKNLFTEYNKENQKINENIGSRIELMKNSLEKLTTTSQIGMETIGNEIVKSTSTTLEILKKIEILDSVANNLNNIGELVKNEMSGIKSEVLNALGSIGNSFNEITKIIADIQNSLVKSTELFTQSKTALANMSTMMDELNKNYLESLGKIAGLAEGMRKGVEKVGEGMHEAVGDLVSEMKKDIGALEKEYEKTLGDISQLAKKFEGLNNQIGKMTQEVKKNFEESFDRQTKLSDFTKNILEHIKDYFEKEDARYKEEQLVRQKKAAVDHFDRAALYYYRGNYELALNEIAKSLEIDKTAEYLNLKGLVLTELFRADEAKEAYETALKLEPNLSEIYNNLGLLYFKTKKLDDAVVSFQEALKRNVNYALAYVHLGKALIELEKFDEAIDAFSRALEIDPTNKEAKEAIAMYKEGKIGG